MRAMKKKPTVIDLFAGCGGLSLGLYQAGWQGIFAIEKNEFAFDTLKFNLIEKKKHFAWPEWLPKTNHDIDEVLNNHRADLERLRGNVDLVAGGPPCQGFSMAGKRIEKDVRNKLVFSYIKFVELVRPKMLFFENVKGFTYAFNKKKGAVPYSQLVVEKLSELGYNIHAEVLDFSEFGVPQRRKRFILVGVRGDYGRAKDFFNSLKSKRDSFLNRNRLSGKSTLADAISDLLEKNGVKPTPDRRGFFSGMYGEATSALQVFLRKKSNTESTPNSHSFAKHTKERLECYKKLLEEYPKRGRRIDGDERTQWNIRQRGITVMDGNQLAPTITAHPDDYLHYCEPRIMTVRECARIQTFPDWYEIKRKYTTGGKMRKVEVPRYTQVGNAIPPLFAHQAGLTLKEILKR